MSGTKKGNSLAADSNRPRKDMASFKALSAYSREVSNFSTRVSFAVSTMVAMSVVVFWGFTTSPILQFLLLKLFRLATVQADRVDQLRGGRVELEFLMNQPGFL